MSDYDFAIRVEGLGKQYFVADIEDVARRQFNLRRTLTTPIRRTVKLLQGQATGAADLDKTIWALKDVSFEVKRGQLLGVIGANGAGKSRSPRNTCVTLNGKLCATSLRMGRHMKSPRSKEINKVNLTLDQIHKSSSYYLSVG